MRSLSAAAAVLAAALVIGSVGDAAAQPSTASATRPRVCLVLSGGGARGAAHIGVLKVLEAYRVPIDCITGTSMGALVGAGYASGMTIAEMEKLTEQLTIDVLFRETPPRQEWTPRRKQEDATNLFRPQIGIGDDGSVRLAKGVVSGVRLEVVLREISRIKGDVEFDRLPIPFRAVATDLVTGKAKIFERGELASAMRASMSVPGVIAPAEFDGMMLVDGGLVNNLPVDVARSMGADVVIAVNLGTPLASREKITDVRSITGQMIAILTEQNVQQTLATLRPTDILILPELGDYSAGDFDNMEKTWPLGEAAARKVADRLAALSLPADQYAALRQRQTAPLVPDTRPVDVVAFTPMHRVNPEYAGALLGVRPGAPIDQDALDRSLLRLYGTGDFEHVSYRLIESPTRRILNVEAVEKSWGPNYLRFGLGLSSDFDGSAFFNLLGQYRRTWLNANGGEWRTDVALGRNNSIVSELYQPLDARQRFFVAPRVELESNYLGVWLGDTRISEYSLPTAIAGVDAGANLGHLGEVRLGLYGGITKPDLNNGVPLTADERTTTVVGVRLRAYVDQIDNRSFPRKGYAAGLELLKGLEALGSDVGYDRWDASAMFAFASGPHSLSLLARGAGPISGDAGPLYVSVPWGGFLQQSGYS
ncbi:MAG TPA: patatin-like phospholipase family protein, partial [Casimicrobiaceae bacterium]|nr:patatin-like phospholipase family protein [Casimicrobiaceae bacterium]